MKTKSSLFSLFFLVTVVLQAQRFDFKFKFDGVDREFILAKPSGATPASGYPVVMMLHGTTGDGEKFYNLSGFKELGEKEKFISVFPSSLAYCYIGDMGFNVTNTKWNNGDLQANKCTNRTQDFKDDVKFIRKVIDTVSKRMNVNPKMIFISGFSNGSVMTNKLAVEASDLFSAAASNAGALSNLDSAKPLRYIPVYQTFGTQDQYLIEAFGRSLPFNDSLINYLVPLSRTALGAFNISNTYTNNKTANLYHYYFEKPKSSTQKNYYYYSFIKDLDHEFPNGVNHPVVAAVLYWEFFKQAIAKTTPYNAVLQPIKPLKIYPNPSNEIANIVVPDYWKEVDLTIINTMGECVWNKKSLKSHMLAISKHQMGNGMYTILASCKTECYMGKLIFQ
mgnify:CR=1 FL=1